MKIPILIICLACMTHLGISQTNSDNMLEKFTSRPAEEILQDLYALKLRERNGEKMEQPLITLLLGGNRTAVRGFLIDQKNEAKDKGVVVKLQDSNDVLFVDIYAIAGIVIHEADRIVPFLIDLTPADIPKTQTVTKLDVKKQQAEEIAILVSHFGEISISFHEELPSLPSDLYFTRQFLTDISMALITIGKTDAGKQAIKDEIKTIQIQRATDLIVKRDKTTLFIQFPFNKSYTTNLQRHLLIDKLYDVL